jgi:hypothetical protein
MAKLVRERYPQVSIVMTSGWANGQDNHGFEVVPKPYDLEKISEMVLSRMRNKSDTPHEG